MFDEEGVIDHLDIANHIIADKVLRKPSTYRESFEILYEERLIPKVLSDTSIVSIPKTRTKFISGFNSGI